MKRIRSKLNNSQGVSIIIALVFMLICLFVGGVVLTSATVNAGRMKNIERNKVFMDHRSAAMLLAEELKSKSGDDLKLEFVVTETTVEDVSISPQGSVVSSSRSEGGTPTTTYLVRISNGDATLKPAQEVVVHSAIQVLTKDTNWKALFPEYSVPQSGDLKIIKNGAEFPYVPSNRIPTKYNWVDAEDKKSKVFTSFCLSGELFEELGDNTLQKFSEPVTIMCGQGKRIIKKNTEENSFDFYFMLNQGDEKNPKIDVRMYSDSPVVKKLPEIVKIVKDTNFSNQDNMGKKYTIKESVLTIVWQGPTIAKGDAPKCAEGDDLTK